jgi:hypothetical protein
MFFIFLRPKIMDNSRFSLNLFLLFRWRLLLLLNNNRCNWLLKFWFFLGWGSRLLLLNLHLLIFSGFLELLWIEINIPKIDIILVDDLLLFGYWFRQSFKFS